MHLATPNCRELQSSACLTLDALGQLSRQVRTPGHCWNSSASFWRTYSQGESQPGPRTSGRLPGAPQTRPVWDTACPESPATLDPIAYNRTARTTKEAGYLRQVHDGPAQVRVAAGEGTRDAGKAPTPPPGSGSLAAPRMSPVMLSHTCPVFCQTPVAAAVCAADSHRTCRRVAISQVNMICPGMQDLPDMRKQCCSSTVAAARKLCYRSPCITSWLQAAHHRTHTRYASCESTLRSSSWSLMP